MTAAERGRLKALVDRARRELVEPLQVRFAGIFYCSGCGMELNDWTPGCKTCHSRFENYRERGVISEWEFQTFRRAVRDYAHHVRGKNGQVSRPNKAGGLHSGGWVSKTIEPFRGARLDRDGAFNSRRELDGGRRFS